MDTKDTMLETLDLLGLDELQEAVASDVGEEADEVVTLVSGAWRADELDKLDQVVDRLSARPETAEAASALKLQVATARARIAGEG